MLNIGLCNCTQRVCVSVTDNGFVSPLLIWSLGYIGSSLIGSFEYEAGASCIGPILRRPLSAIIGPSDW